MQSTNTTHNKNLKNPRKCSFSAMAKPTEDTIKVQKEKVKHFNPRSDEYAISPYIINTLSTRQVMGIKKIIN